MHDNYKILLDESEMPTQWYNIVVDLPESPSPALHPGNGAATAEDLVLVSSSADRTGDVDGALH